MKKVIDWLDRNLEECILAVLLATMTCVMFMQICLRFIFHNTLIWPEELARDCFIYTAFFCLPMCIRRNTLLKVDIVVEFLPEKLKNIVTYLGDVVTLLVVAFLWYSSISVLQNAIKVPDVSQTMGFDMVWIYGMPFVALGLAVLRSIEHLVRRAKEMKKGKEA